MINYNFFEGDRRLRLPSVRSLGEEGRGPKPSGALRKHSQNGFETSLREQSEQITKTWSPRCYQTCVMVHIFSRTNLLDVCALEIFIVEPKRWTWTYRVKKLVSSKNTQNVNERDRESCLVIVR